MFDPGAIPIALRAAADAALVRIEEAGLNAAQPAEQLLVDGWLLRFSPGKARRARSVNAISPGRLDLDAKLGLCRLHYERAGLPLLFRITPFSQPALLDTFLERNGFEAFDQTRVMTCALPAPVAAGRAAAADRISVDTADIAEFVRVVGALRGSPEPQIRAHEARLRASLLQRASVRRILRVDGEAVAAGQAVVEAEVAGLYDIVTAPAWRGRGLGRALSALLLDDARAQGAEVAYLQVDAGNEPARRIYSALGFEDRYAYWYRRPAGVDDDLQH